MRLLLLCLLVSCMIAAAVSQSKPTCYHCGKSLCDEDLSNCRCGTVMDWCECCEYCAFCRGDYCTTGLARECADGLICVPDDPNRTGHTRGRCQ